MRTDYIVHRVGNVRAKEKQELWDAQRPLLMEYVAAQREGKWLSKVLPTCKSFTDGRLQPVATETRFRRLTSSKQAE
jgi:hypothetical protein